MSQTVISGVVGFVSAAVAILVIQYGGVMPQPVQSAVGTPHDTQVSPAGDQDGHIQGDVDCNEEVDTLDVLAVLFHEADLDVQQEEPCPDIGTLAAIPGPEGPPGPQGPAGPEGPQGATGISGYEVVEDLVEFDTTGTFVSTRGCPGDKVALGGGLTLALGPGAGFDREYLLEDGPTAGGDGWKFTITRITDDERTFALRFICADVTE